MGHILFGVGVVLAAIIAAVAMSSATWAFWESWRSGDEVLFRALIGGFAGAFFAFVFVRLGEGLKRLYERQEKNHSSLVMAEHVLNTYLGIIGDNVFVVDDFTEIMSEARLAGEPPPISMNQFTPYEIDKELLVGYTNIDFVNDFHSLHSSVRKLNDSLATADRAHEQAKRLFLDQKIGRGAYNSNMRIQRDKLQVLKGFLEEARDQTIEVMASAQLQLKDPPFFVRLLRILVRRTYTAGFRRQLPLEVDRIKQDIETVAAASQVRITSAERRRQENENYGGNS